MMHVRGRRDRLRGRGAGAVLIAAMLASTTSPVAEALANGLGLTPGMGWNSDYCVACSNAEERGDSPVVGGFENDGFIRHIIDTMSKPPFSTVGYKNVNMDSEWDLPHRDSNGNLQPDPAKWPNGIESVIDYAHSKGLGFGVYGDRGDKDCAGNPGNLGHETQDAEFYASIGIDWYKSDSCSATGDHSQAIAEYTTMSKALMKATDGKRPIWFALCGWNPWYSPVMQGIANSARIGPDTVCGWPCVMTNVDNTLPLGHFAGPRDGKGGAWNDLCLLLNPGWNAAKGAKYNMTYARHRSQFSLYAVMSANLLMTGNLTALDPFAIETWTNPEVVAVNQDPMGKPHSVLNSTDAVGRVDVGGHVDAQVAECGGEVAEQTWDLGKPMTGFVHNAASDMCLNAADCGKELIYDGCTTAGGTCSGKGKFNNEQFELQASGALVSAMPHAYCVTVSSSDTVVLEPCHGSAQTAVATNQTWSYTNSTKQLRNAAGLCLTAPLPSASNGTMVLGKPLSASSGGVEWAVLLFNNSPASTEVVCSEGCMASMGFAAGDNVAVRDLWSRSALSGTTGAAGISMSVDGDGASRLLKLSKAAESQL